VVPGRVVEYRAVPLSWDDDYPIVHRVPGRDGDSGESRDTDVTREHAPISQSVWVHQRQSAEAIAIPGLRWDGGAPLPIVIATDYRTLFACHEAGPDEGVLVAEFVQCTSVRFGLPNDEVLHGPMR
jgi:hypothetical protein